MDDRTKKAFDFAADLTKQLITLATAVIGAVVTFGDKGLVIKVTGTLKFALGLYGISAVLGGVALMALTGQLGSPKVTDTTCTTYAPGVRFASGAQIVTFMVATILFAIASIGLLGPTAPGGK